MTFINIDSMDQGHSHMYYEIVKDLAESLEKKENRTEIENHKLNQFKLQCNIIENWAVGKMNENLHWTKEELVLNFGFKPVLILVFYPGSESYKKFGKEISATLVFDEEDLTQIVENINNKVERVSSTIKIKILKPDFEEEFHEIESREIFEVLGRKIR